MGLNADALAAIRARLANPGTLDEQQLLDVVLRLAAMHRSTLLANSVVSLNGLTVQNGPFAGMTYLRRSAEGALLPRLIGSYESELHPHILALAGEGLETIVDVGCAEGYYAVGLARLMPDVTVHAYDIDPGARAACAALAEVNGVQDRVRIGELFTGEDYARFTPGRTLVFMDVEGAEDRLLDPAAFPALRGLKVLVETHSLAVPDMTARIITRFEDSHDIVRVDQGAKTVPPPDWFGRLSHLDFLLAGWEMRVRPTPWLVMRPKVG